MRRARRAAIALLAGALLLPAALRAAERVALAGGRFTLMIPPGFRELTAEEVGQKFPRGNAPQHVYANDTQSVSIAITFSSASVTPEELPQLQAALEETLPRLTPGFQWIDRGLVTINGVQWFRLEFVSAAVDTEIHNEMYGTSFDGKMVAVNFNAAAAVHNTYRGQLEKSRESIVLQR
jgi:hypothetical protein